jgi:TonB family protein
MKRRKSYRPYPQNHDQIGILASLALHAILAFLLITTKAPHPPTTTTIEVTIEPAVTLQKRQQIVSQSEAPQQAPLEDTTRLSDTDSRAETEQIRRGDGGGIPGQQSNTAPSMPQPPEAKTATSKAKPPAHQEPKRQLDPRQQDKPAATEQTKKNSAGKRDLHLKDLKLDDSTLALKFGTTPRNQAAAASPDSAASAPMKSLSEYQAFSRPPGSGAAFFGSAGISDHLPNLPDGDITLLNAKANIYASFVRRVAIQVFTQLRSQGWERLSAQQLRQLSGFATVVAVLNPTGKFIRAEIIESSGSDAFDGVLHTSATKGASDPNPPPGAQAKDGNIHFIFKARSWSQIGVNRRSGAPVEQRWLLLATGLE